MDMKLKMNDKIVRDKKNRNQIILNQIILICVKINSKYQRQVSFRKIFSPVRGATAPTSDITLMWSIPHIGT